MKTTTRPVKVNPLIDAPADRYAIWERRLHIDDIFDELALPWDTDADVVLIYHAIVAYCKENRVMPRAVAWEVDNNNLYANDRFVKRVGPCHRYAHDSLADYWEGKILARQSAFMPD